MPHRPLIRPFSRDARGEAAVQFALLAPALVLLIVGSLEVAITLAVGGMLESAVLAASRYGVTGFTQEGVSREDRIRQIIDERTLGFVDMDEIVIRTLVYESFGDIGQPEPCMDPAAGGQGDDEDDDGGDGDEDDHENGDGDGSSGGCDNYRDVNGNGQWDQDMGRAGLGGPGDILLYEVEYETTGITGLMRPILGHITHKAAVAVRNEPF